MAHEALLRALAHFDGNQSEMARAVGCSQQHLSYCIRKKTPIAARHVLATERATGVARHELRPDLYPAPEQDAAA